jgi:meiotically up-regulated gene 157 (Mug157) protein
MIFSSGETTSEPTLIYPVYRKNDVLFINNQMHMFVQKGFCWDEEIQKQKYRTCVDEILPTLKLNSSMVFDSVYVFKRESYDSLNTLRERIYISPLVPVVLKKELWQADSLLVQHEQIREIKLH